MARKPQKTYRRAPARWVKIDGDVNDGAGLAVGDVTSTVLGDTVETRSQVNTVRCNYTLRGNTAGEGPVEFGWAHSDYTAAEIEESLEVVGSWDEGDLVAAEQAKRKVRRIGSFQGEDAEEIFNEGRPMSRKLGWILLPQDTIQLWMRNFSGATFAAGKRIQADGKAKIKQA